MSGFTNSPTKAAEVPCSCMPDSGRVEVMKREMLEGAKFFEEAKKIPASEIRKWGNDRGVAFPEDFVEFFAEFAGLYPDEWGYQFIF